MVAFWLDIWQKIHWGFSVTELIFFGALAVWIWLIWPLEQYKQLQQNVAEVMRALWSSVAIMALWLLNANVMEGMHVHFLGLVTLSMMFGWRMASILALFPTLFFSCFVMGQPFAFGAYSFIAVLLPLFIGYLFYVISHQYLPRHLFIYIFFGGFFNAGIMTASHIGLWSLWLWCSGQYTWTVLIDNYLLLIPLMVFPEALLNGMALTLLVVYRPQWLFDYRDSEYLT